ncbi:hypothetical protein FVER14953_20237 [Fusarium verticillioides]|nr:hypothetical protein FVER14953_20237 [Fusarium verticillioides]
MYHQQWTGAFDVNDQSSQTSSPMAPEPPVTGESLHANYIHVGSRTPGPPKPYMGAFGVSNGPEPSHMSQHYYVNIEPPVNHQDHMIIRDNQHVPMGIHHREMPPAPLLSKRPGPSRSAVADDPVDEHKNCFGHEVPPTLKSTCPDEERCIFESRWEHRHQKGQDMWDSIQTDFKDRFQKCPGKEILQMKFKRGRSKYIEWIDKDAPWMRVEKDRYQMILDMFYEMGGSRNMRLNASDIEVKVVGDLKLEEGLYMESHGDANIRRRRKLVSIRKQAGRGIDNINDMLTNDEMMSVGSHNTHEDEVINQVHGPPNFKIEEDGPGGQHNMKDMHLWDQQMKMESEVMQQRNDRMQEGSYMDSHGDAKIRRRHKTASTRKRIGHRIDNVYGMPSNNELVSAGSYNTQDDEQTRSFIHSQNFYDSTSEAIDSASDTDLEKLLHSESNIPIQADFRSHNLEPGSQRSILGRSVTQGQNCKCEDAQTAYSDQRMTSYTRFHIMFTDA